MEEDYLPPQEETIQESTLVEKDDDTVHCNIKTPRILRRQYDELCARKGTDRSKRLRNFMMFELKKEADREAQKEIEKPKDLNTGVSTV
jgi:hypothetical protein